MPTSLVLTVLGEDRPGLVEALSHIIAAHEGNWQPKRVVVLEFPSLEQAKRWYNSEEYRGPKALRFKTATSKMILVEGA